jgi:hypothetical protein
MYQMELQPYIPTVGISPARIDRRSLFRVRGLIAEHGTTYNIKVNWKGKTAEATTVIPPKPPALTYRLGQGTDEFGATLHFASATFKARANETYQVGTRSRLLRPSQPFQDISPQIALEKNVARLEDADTNGILTLRTGTYPSAWLDSLYEVQLLLYAYDKPYYDYVRSLGGRTNDLVFNVPTTNPKWNVTGDGIGLFVGLSTSRTPLRRNGR